MEKSQRSKAGSEKKEVHLKIKITPDQHRDVKVAAAERGIPICDFLKVAVLAYTEKIVAEYLQRRITQAEKVQSSQEG